ncbi:hypothetical protein [Rossellomorea marisflavi]|uniref:hypothetical protein n=1 Tax=Rossellomorea marisflavi TaxID=189381 RepID=UPI003FA159BF
MKNFLINLNIGIMLVLAVAFGCVVYQDATMTNERKDKTYAYFIAKEREKGEFPTKQQKGEMEALEIEDAKRIITSDTITGEEVVFYTYKVYTPSALKKMLNKTMMPLSIQMPKETNS